MSYSIEIIAELIGAKRIGNNDYQIDWILTDSRSLCFPEETLFFALKSKRNDGHKYINDLYAVVYVTLLLVNCRMKDKNMLSVISYWCLNH